MSPSWLVEDLCDQELVSRFTSASAEEGQASDSVLVFRYDQTSAQVKNLENRAQHLSGEAREETTVATNMLKDVTTLEQDLPSALKVPSQVYACPQEARWPQLCSCPCSGRRGHHGLRAERPDRSSHQEQRGL